MYDVSRVVILLNSFYQLHFSYVVVNDFAPVNSNIFALVLGEYCLTLPLIGLLFF